MSNIHDNYLVDRLADYIVEFTELVENVSKIMGQEPEEVIRELVNANWDIRECLNDKDLTSIRDAFEDNRKDQL